MLCHGGTLSAVLHLSLSEQWKSYAADGPSDFYILNTKIGGVLFAVFGVVALVLPLFLN